MSDEHEHLKNALRESRLSTGILSELAKCAQELPDGVPLPQAQRSLQYAREHLSAATAAVIALETIAAQKREQEKAKHAR